MEGQIKDGAEYSAAGSTAKSVQWKRAGQQGTGRLRGEIRKQQANGGQARRRHRTHKVTPTRANKTGKKGLDSRANEPYVVLITNVENDFAKLHQAGLRSYCMLDPTVQRDVCATGVTNAVAAEGAESDAVKCQYTLRCRTETRSAELCVYGAAAASVATIFTSHTRAAPTHRGRIADAETTTNTAINAMNGVVAGNNSITGDVAATPSAVQPAAVPSEVPFASLQHMVSMLRHKPYLGYPPKMYLHEMSSDHNSDQKTQEEETVSAPTGQDNTTSGIVAADGCQSRLATALAVTSAKLTVKQMRHQLSDLSGFVCCWPLRPRHFRLVFKDSTALFAAKRLLDQFELSNHTRVSLRLSDALTRAYDAFVSAQERVESADVVV